MGIYFLKYIEGRHRAVGLPACSLRGDLSAVDSAEVVVTA